MTIKLEYIWIGGNQEIRSKVRFLNNKNFNSNDISTVPDWNYDGSSTNQASTGNSEVILKPVRLYSDPLTKTEAYFVLCETFIYEENELIAHNTNKRSHARELFTNVDEFEPMFGMEFEFFVKKNGFPIGYVGEHTPPQGRYYCSVGNGNAFGRDILELVTSLALSCGINITGYNLEVAPGQMEIQICEKGLKAGDDSIILKYLLARVGEINGLDIDWHSKPLEGDWNGSGCHVNFSTKQMREDGGWEHISRAIENLRLSHKDHLQVYGDDNHLRLTGKHETSSIEEFTCGVANRGCSVRIPRETALNQKGYFEDRRPSSSADMYLVTSKLFWTCTH